MFSSSTSQLTVNRPMSPKLAVGSGSRLPYDVMRIIFDYLSQISDNGWHIQLEKSGKPQLVANPYFVGIQDVFRFKMNSWARFVELRIQQWESYHSNSSYVETVTALEVPHRIHDQATINANLKKGMAYDSRCYTYVDPETEMNMVAYVDSCKFSFPPATTDAPVFQQGCVYGANGETHVISGFGTDETPGTARMVVNKMNITWDLNDYLDWDPLFENYEETEDDEIPEGFDLNTLPTLQMYM